VFSVSYAQNTKIVANNVLNFQKEKQQFLEKNLFAVNDNFKDTAYKKEVENATMATLDLNAVNKIVSEANRFIDLKIPYNGEIISVLLYKVEIQTDDFQLDTDKEKNVAVEKGVYYRGIIKNDLNSLASFNFFKNQMNGIISNGALQNLVIGKIQTDDNVDNYIIYADKDLKIKNTFECATKDFLPKPAVSDRLNKTALLTNHCVTMYFEMDYDLYVANGNSISQSNIWMTSVFNNVQTIFTNDNIKVAVKSIFIWTTLDPYTGANSVENLIQFHQNRPTFNGDLGQLVAMDTGGFGGVAVTINGLCSENNFSYSDVFFSYQSVPIYSWTVQVITHELGHLMGSPHTHGCYWNGNNTAIDGCGSSAGYPEGSCPIAIIPSSQQGGTIMSYCHLIGGVGINFANGFGLQPTTLMINAIDNANCLGVDCITTCISFIHNIQVQNFNNTAILSWMDDSNATEWQVGYVVNGQEPVWSVTNSNPFTFQDLVQNSYYFFYVKSNCPNIEGIIKSSALILTNEQAQNYCAGSGIPFYDSGWNLKNYTDNEDWTRVITPINPNDKLKVDFESVNLETDYDFLKVYDGLSTADPLLTNDLGINGTIVQGPFTSTHPSGALTFQFNSDQYVNESGWIATLSCPTLGLNEAKFIDFTYFPNPSTNEINFYAKNEIQNISIFTIDGKLLFDTKINQSAIKMDLSPYAIGTYIFKLTIEHQIFSIKVLKK
jgi:hypothetical protein